MSEYMLLILYDPSKPPDDGPSKPPEHARLTEEMRGAGHYLSGAGLAPASMFARRLSHGAGETLVTDGPFEESKEAVGGYFVVDCSGEQAMSYAALIPVDSRSWVEVRRVGIYVR